MIGISAPKAIVLAAYYGQLMADPLQSDASFHMPGQRIGYRVSL